MQYHQLLFRRNMCRSHYSLTNKSSTVTNESITVSTATIFVTKSGTLTTNLGNAMEIDIVIETVMEFVGEMCRQFLSLVGKQRACL